MRSIVAPSILASDFARLAEEAASMKKCGADWLHVDCMDGHFVRNLTIGPPIVAALRKHTDLFLDVHLMVTDPGAWVDELAAGGADGVTFHLECFAPVPYPPDAAFRLPDAGELAAAGDLLRRVRAAGMRAGLALRPLTPLAAAMPLLTAGAADMLLAMTVEPGFGGQAFMPDVMGKVAAARAAFPALDIQVDGGLSPKTIDAAAAAGANVIVAGSAVFGAADRAATVALLRASVEREQLAGGFEPVSGK